MDLPPGFHRGGTDSVTNFFPGNFSRGGGPGGSRGQETLPLRGAGGWSGTVAHEGDPIDGEKYPVLRAWEVAGSGALSAWEGD
jgi:hypothetical protein